MRETITVPFSSGVFIPRLLLPLLKTPRVVVKVTEVSLGTGAPELFDKVAVTAVELAPSARIVSGAALRRIEAVSSVSPPPPPPEPHETRRGSIPITTIMMTAYRRHFLFMTGSLLY
jgi:hypothetical protein